MESATQSRSLVKKIAEVMKAVGGVPKRGYNSFHKYHYATEADILDAVRSELASRHCILVPSVESFEIRDVATQKGVDRLTSVLMRFTAMDGETGESFTFGMLGQGQDPGDKGAYKAETGAEKYAVKKLFMLGDDADPEGDGKTDEAHAKPPKAATKPATPKPVDHSKLVAAFAGLGIPRGHLEDRIGKPLTEATEADIASLRKLHAEKKALAALTPEKEAERLEQEKAESAIAAEKAFKDAKNSSPMADAAPLSKQQQINAVFDPLMKRIKAANSKQEAALVLAEAGAQKILAPLDIKALTRAMADRCLILDNAANPPPPAPTGPDGLPF